MADGLIKQAPIKGLNLMDLLGSTLFTGALIIFLGTGAVIAGAFAYGRYTRSQTESLKTKIADIEAGFEQSVLDQSIRRDQKLQGIQELLRSHLIPSNIFDLLERNTLPQVRFTVFSYSADAKKIDVTGEAASYSTLANQVRTFEALKEVDRVDFGGLSVTEKGLLNFKMTLVFKPKLLQYGGN